MRRYGRAFLGLLGMLVTVWGCLLFAAPASAQTPVFNPRFVSFTPSADHNATVTVGTVSTPVLTRYELRIFADATATSPITTSDLGKPAPAPTGLIEIDKRDVFVAIPTGSYVARVAAIGPGGEGVSAPTDPFGRLSPAAAVPKPALR